MALRDDSSRLVRGLSSSSGTSSVCPAISSGMVLVLRMLHNLSVILVLVYIALHQSQGIASIGIRLLPDGLITTLMVGIAAYGIPLIANGLYRRWREGKKEIDASSYNAKMALMYRTRFERGVYLGEQLYSDSCCSNL